MNYLFLLLLMLVFPSTSHAYIDPGSGMILLQGLIAILGGCIVFIRNPKKTIINWIRKVRGLKDLEVSQENSVDLNENSKDDDKSND
tara:strand:+ start:171 stop:431 length:261 start_codon:yes stop_codon:yes gene_type:complete